MAEAAPTLTVLVLAVIAAGCRAGCLVMEQHSNPAVPHWIMRHVAPAGATPAVWAWFIAQYFAAATLAIFGIHVVALAQGSDKPFQRSWTFYVYVKSVFVPAALLIAAHHPAGWLLLAWQFIILVIGLPVFYPVFDEWFAVPVLGGIWSAKPAFLFILSILPPLGAIRPAGRHAPAITQTTDRMSSRFDYDWTLETPEGRPLSVADLRGKVLFVHFWASWCAPCRSELPSLQKLFDLFRTNPDMALLLVSEEDMSDIRKFMRYGSFTFPVYRLSGRRPAALSSVVLPTTYIVSRSGEIVYRQQGAAVWDLPRVAEFIRRLLGP
ncbi:MAG TPA: TlpA disulfide reductase family protein [Elusimicrobiota bacterium]|nr:TlpA disulfide reductase family protein [Elusimicrobiota bacterium]